MSLVLQFAPLRRGTAADVSRWPATELLATALLVIAFAAPGLGQIDAMPGWIEAIFDLGAVTLFTYGLALLLARRVPLAVPTLGLLYLGIVVVGLLTADDPAAAIVSLRNFTLLPATALVLALNGWSERGARIAIVALTALCAFEFALTFVQDLQVEDSDEIIGTMGDFNGWVVGFCMLMASAVALGRYLLEGRRAWGWLAAAALLPLFTIWALVKVVVVLIPVVFGATIVAYLLFRSERDWRRAGLAALAGALSAGAILGSYAQQDQLGVFTDSQTRDNYLRDARFFEPPPEPRREEGRPGAAKPKPRPKPKPRVQPTPGRQTQWKNAIEIAGESPRTAVVGHGLGTATYAANLGVDPPADPKVGYASLNAFGTLLIERGWLGLLVVGLCAVALGAGALRLLPRGPAGDWRSAVVLAYPAILLVTVAGAFYASPFQEPATEATFWILTSIVLSLLLRRRQET